METERSYSDVRRDLGQDLGRDLRRDLKGQFFLVMAQGLNNHF